MAATAENRGWSITFASGMRWARRWLTRGVASCFVAVIGYAGLAVLGLIPVNRHNVPPDQGIAIYVASNGVHTDIYVPATTSVFDWRTLLLPEHFAATTSNYRYVSLGWGDRDFYVNTPTWEDVSVVTTAKALMWPTETIMHAQFGRVYPESDAFRRVTLTIAQYERLVASLRASFQPDQDGRVIRLHVPTYNSLDCFYRGAGTYHAFNTCNCWTGRMLRESGVTAGWFTPTTYSVLFHLPAAIEDDPHTRSEVAILRQKTSFEPGNTSTKRQQVNDPLARSERQCGLSTPTIHSPARRVGREDSLACASCWYERRNFKTSKHAP